MLASPTKPSRKRETVVIVISPMSSAMLMPCLSCKCNVVKSECENERCVVKSKDGENLENDNKENRLVS